MNRLMITWTDIFYGIADFFMWIFKGIKFLAHSPNIIFGLLVVGGLAYWIMRLNRYNHEAKRNGTIE